MATITKDLGVVTAYAYAVEGGYTGTEEEFTALLGHIAEILNDLDNFSVTVTTLPAGSTATASYENGILSLGIPKGDKGDTGATPHLTIGTVTTGAAGSSAAASVTGTDENPVLNLTIPKGDPGEVPAASIAPTEASTTAAQKHEIGERFWLSGTLYIATATIAAGSTIVTSGSGANCKADVLSDDLQAQSDRITTVKRRTDDILIFSTLAFEQGAFKQASGAATQNTNNAIRSTEFVNKHTVSIECDPAYEFVLWAWNEETGSYVGFLQSDGTFGNTGDYKFLQQINPDWSLGYKYKITFYNYNAHNTAILPAAGSNLSLISVTDTTFSRENKAADAKLTGEMLIYNHDTLVWEQGTIFPEGDGTYTASAVAIRAVIPENAIKIKCASGYKFSLNAYNKTTGSFIGNLRGDGTFSKQHQAYFSTEYTIDRSLNYTYKIALYNSDVTVNVIPSEGANVVVSSLLAGDVKHDLVTFEKSLEKNGSLMWVQGSLNYSNASAVSTDYAIRTIGFIPENTIRITCANGYKMSVWAFDADTKNYVGHLQIDGSYLKTSYFCFVHEYIIDRTLNYLYKIILYNEDETIGIIPSEGSNCITCAEVDKFQNVITANKFAFVGTPDTIFENNDESALAGVDDGLINSVSVVKVSDSMFYMYYEAYADGESGYNNARLCFAYSADGETFIKGFPSGVTPPVPDTNMVLPKGTNHGACVVKVGDANYPYRMIGIEGTNAYRVAKMWKSADGINWVYVRQLTNGYNDSFTSCVVRGNLLKIFLRTRNEYGRAIGIIITDLDGNRAISRWNYMFSLNDVNRQLYQASASIYDDKREILLPTVYDPGYSTQDVWCFLLDGSNCDRIPLDTTAVLTEGINSIYFGSGIIDIGLKTYAFYTTRSTNHESTSEETVSAIRRIEVTDTTIDDVVTP